MKNEITIETDSMVFVWKPDSAGIEEIIFPEIPLTAMVGDNVEYEAKIILTPIENK